MSAEATLKSDISSIPAAVKAALDAACSYIAPTWPLDQMIAVNPLWELRHLSYQDAAAQLAARGNIRAHLNAEDYTSTCTTLARRAGSAEHDRSAVEFNLAEAARRLGHDSISAAAGSANEDALGHWLNISDLLDQGRDSHQMSWHEEIIHQISQFCADSFRSNGPCPDDAPGGTLFTLWLDCIRADRGVAILMAARGLREEFASLPDTREALLAQAIQELDLQEEAAEAYSHSLLLDINGWASWIAYLRWQARLQGSDSDLMLDLLAIRMAWELALWRFTQKHRAADFRRLQSHWQQQIAVPNRLQEQHREAQQQNWQWQTAAELAYQQNLTASLRANGSKANAAAPAAALQAVFCIDVRSEVLRRHLEAQHDTIQTKGFAGFFGLPIQFQTADCSFQRPQLPGLLAPAMSMRTASNQTEADRNQSQTSWLNTADSPAAMFSLVEASGPYYLWKLLRDSFYPASSCDPASALADKTDIELWQGDQPLTLDQRIDLAAGVLHAMNLEEGFAPTVLLVGHGAESPNNPQAASLNCGACGGQSGEFNALLLARLLNDEAVRKGLAARGVEIPEATRFVATLHETVSDDLKIVDNTELSDEIRTWLDQASIAARRERAGKLGLDAGDSKTLDKAIRKRARDWSQVRPEWGLAGNAAFIVAPRERTRGIDLQGRSFLHDYDWRKDQDLSVLELIMTAPMVVTNWINMQYNASVVDNERFGSGNKVLHNVVGGNIGVFEGNGGDLRVGLPMQSVHNGDHWMHLPLRLSVFIAAPANAIMEIYQRHEVVRQLVDNDWLYLFRLDDSGDCQQLYQDQWLKTGNGQ